MVFLSFFHGRIKAGLFIKIGKVRTTFDKIFQNCTVSSRFTVQFSKEVQNVPTVKVKSNN